MSTLTESPIKSFTVKRFKSLDYDYKNNMKESKITIYKTSIANVSVQLLQKTYGEMIQICGTLKTETRHATSLQKMNNDRTISK